LLSWAQQVPLSEEPSITFGAPPTYYNFMALESREYLSTITGDFPIMGAGWTITGDLGYKNTQEMITYDTSDITSTSFTASGAIVSGSQYISESSNITGVSLSSSSISSGRIYDLEYYANEITVNPFIFEVQAKPNSGAPYVFTLPFIPTSSGGVYDFTVNWGDGSNIETITEIIDGVPKTHTYSTSGGYDVSILGTMEGWTTHGSIVPSGDTMYISELKQWGCFNFNNHFITEMEIGDTGTISLTGSQFVNSAIFENYGTRITATDIPNLSNIESLDVSFAGARTSIPNLCLWDLSKIKKMRFTFVMAQGIFAPINNWDISNITDMSGMFFFMSVLRPLNNWDVSNVTNMRYMFCISTLFNQDISMWDVSNVTDMSYMFNCAREFNQPLNNWDVSNVTDMSGMFGNDYFPLAGSGKFNQPLNNWITTSCTNMSQMFYNARYFDQDISMWDVSNVTDMTEMFYGATLSTTNYSNLLNGWSTQEVQPNVVFSGGNSKYNSSAADARNHLITVHGWTITDGGLE
jgi:surface protein